MDNNLFFRWVWRFNALAIAILLCGWAFLLSTIFLPGGRIYGPPRADRAPPPPVATELVLQLADTLADGQVLFSYGERPYVVGGSSFEPPRGGRVANYLFYDAKSGASRWLLPGNKQIVTSKDIVWSDGTASDGLNLRAVPQTGSPTSTATPRTIRAIVFDVTPTDAAKGFEVYASRNDGTGVTKLISGADEITTFTPTDPDTIVARARAAAASRG